MTDNGFTSMPANESYRSEVAYLRSRALLAPLISADVFGTPLPTGVAGIPKLDQVLAAAPTPATPEEREAILTTFGAFVGEALRGAHGGDWKENEGEGWGIANAGTPGTFVNPFEWVKNGNVQGHYEAWRRSIPGHAAKRDP